MALAKGDARVGELAKKYGVKGVPRLIVLRPDGTVLHENAVKRLTEEGPAVIEEWLA